jgi:hypothetical protein
MIDQLGEGVFLRFFPHLVLHPTAVSRVADTATATRVVAYGAKVDPSPFALNID